MKSEMFVDKQSCGSMPVVKSITLDSTSYTFSSPRGLIFTTQFAQPAIMVAEKARFEDMKENGLVQNDAVFAGHSLGEYSGLAAMAEFMPFTSLMDVIFYRGLVMQFAVDRDAHASTDYSMVAVNPSRVSKCRYSGAKFRPLVANINIVFNEVCLGWMIDTIAEASGSLLQIVNFNCEGEQYVCTGKVSVI